MMKIETVPALVVAAAMLVCCRAPNPSSSSEQAGAPPAVTSTDKPMANTNAGDKPLPESIGSATMTADGTIVLQLRASDAEGAVMGDGLVRYPPSDPDYAKVLQHLGGLKPGEDKPVPPFPEKW